MLINNLAHNFKYSPTLKQSVFFEKIVRFVSTINSRVFVLKGYAGTGKTSIVQSLVATLPNFNWHIVLLAPTGRAAKVMSQYTHFEANTIHRKIYYSRQSNGQMLFTLQKNKYKNTLFIVDECSMLSHQSQFDFSKNSVLDDLLSFVFSGKNCKLLMIGDTAQLPPIGLQQSYAMDIDYLFAQYGFNVDQIELDEVMRQALNSGILTNATKLRDIFFGNSYQGLTFNLKPYSDIVRLTDGSEVLDAMQNAYHNDGLENCCFVVKSNKRANLYNQNIRARVLFQDNELEAGDLLMVVKNNYFWLKDRNKDLFIANGDIIEVMRISQRINLYGFSFAKTTIRMIDYPELDTFEVVLLLDTLTSEYPALSQEQAQNLYQEVLKDYEGETAFYKKLNKVKENEYFNALQVKFSYAITCHKAQGGQWDTVFVEQPYLPNGLTQEDYRWLYTAFTRAKKKLYLLGFDDAYFD